MSSLSERRKGGGLLSRCIVAEAGRPPSSRCTTLSMTESYPSAAHGEGLTTETKYRNKITAEALVY